ncbi:helix-turn-helix domain-containing protein [Mycolicibacterium hippocampi]|uniref:Uncharacterized protein n=1 Tax=Mycolicibacterium hippocampi TaxID=659824 RepID=A0A850PLW2_9MYCO|nr:helix-turn-helix domain-containing protein [Mycolicibacterium hippocampi]NVN51309.1 hypothetical protein [Mycolicibacterium hippocampi]
MTDDIPALMTVEEVAEYRGVTKPAASALCKGLEVAGWYTHPGRQPIALYSSTDADVTCENGHLKAKRSRGVCRSCRYEAKYGVAA